MQSLEICTIAESSQYSLSKEGRTVASLKCFGHGKYSRLSIKCVGWNKHVGWKFFEDQIKVLDGISMLVGKCLDNH